MNHSYYPVQKRWRRLRPIYESPMVLEMMHEQMELLSFSRANDNGYEFKPQPFHPELRPSWYDSCDWRFRSRPGPRPQYWEWCCHAACHWIVNTNLFVIRQIEPNRPWQIISSQKHSTIVDLKRELIFDFNFLAMGISVAETWKLASKQRDSKLLPLGSYLKLHKWIDRDGSYWTAEAFFKHKGALIDTLSYRN